MSVSLKVTETDEIRPLRKYETMLLLEEEST